MRKIKVLFLMALSAALITGCGAARTTEEASAPDYSNIKVNIPDSKPEHITIATDALTEFTVDEYNVGNCPLVYNNEDGKFHLGTYEGDVIESREGLEYEGNGDSLTLKNFSYTAAFTPAVIFEDDVRLSIADGSSVNISVAEGTEAYDPNFNSTIYALDDLSIEGNGAFYASYPASSGDSCAVRIRGDLNVKEVMFYPYTDTSAASGCAVNADGDVNFESTNVSAVALDSVNTTGIKCKNFNIKDSTVSVTAGKATTGTGEIDNKDIVSAGVVVEESINSANSVVNVDSSEADGISEAISAGKDINVTGGYFNGIAGASGKSIGIKVGNNMSVVNAYSAGRVLETYFKAYGFYVGGDMTVSGNESDTCITAEAGNTYDDEDAVSCALFAKGVFSQDGGSVFATAGESTISRGLQANSGVDFKKGTLNAFGYSSLIICEDGAITVADGTDVFGNDNDFVNGETQSMWSKANNTAFLYKAE